MFKMLVNSIQFLDSCSDSDKVFEAVVHLAAESYVRTSLNIWDCCLHLKMVPQIIHERCNITYTRLVWNRKHFDTWIIEEPSGCLKIFCKNHQIMHLKANLIFGRVVWLKFLLYMILSDDPGFVLVVGRKRGFWPIFQSNFWSLGAKVTL